MCPTRQRKEHLRRRYTTAVHMPSPIHAKLAAEQNENTGKVLLLAFEAITVFLYFGVYYVILALLGWKTARCLLI